MLVSRPTVLSCVNRAMKLGPAFVPVLFFWAGHENVTIRVTMCRLSVRC